MDLGSPVPYLGFHTGLGGGVGTRDSLPPPKVHPSTPPPPPPKNFEIDKVNNQCNEIQIRCKLL